MDVNALPARADGWLVPGDPARLAVVLSQDVDGTTLDVDGRLAVPGSLDSTVTTGQCWRWNLTVADVAQVVGDMAPAANYYSFPFRVTTGSGDSITSLVAGELRLVDRWRGQDFAALATTVLIGPAGAGADPETIAGFVSDYLADNPPDNTALSAHESSERPHPAAESSRDFAGWFNAQTS